MDKRSILQSIIDSGGDCEHLFDDVNKDACEFCPMSKLAKRSDGFSYLSCWDALGLNAIQPDYHDRRKAYYDKAIELLSDILMDDILRGIPVAENT